MLRKTMIPFQRLIRFVGVDGKVYYGDAILPQGVTDARLAKSARLVSGDVNTSFTVDEPSRTIPISRLLSPLPAASVGTTRLLGLNYRKHAAESKMAIPTYPVLFYKPSTALTGPEDDIVIPAIAQTEDNQIDYECELVVVIGKAGRDITESDALDHVLGYSVGNDVSQRTWQLKRGGSQWGVGKMFDTWAPFGPAIVHRDLVGDPGTLTISTKLNGQTVQEESTGDMIFSVRQAIAFLSQGSTLLPGDLIFMGTPSGVGMGRTPQAWLKHGDEVEIGLSGIGTIKNGVRYEKLSKL